MEPNWQLARKRPLLEKRARITQAIRAFFIAQGFLEVETPQRIPANAPELHIDAVPSGDWFLHTSQELAMKRLLAAGYGRIFQLCHFATPHLYHFVRHNPGGETAGDDLGR